MILISDDNNGNSNCPITNLGVKIPITYNDTKVKFWYQLTVNPSLNESNYILKIYTSGFFKKKIIYQRNFKHLNTLKIELRSQLKNSIKQYLKLKKLQDQGYLELHQIYDVGPEPSTAILRSEKIKQLKKKIKSKGWKRIFN